jgi:putative toxin-antitoxin system antitoxin component (TIGR02293 family)
MATIYSGGLFNTFEKEIKNPAALVFRAEEGLPVKVFDELSTVANVSPEELAAVINITAKTVRNYRVKNTRFARPASEQLLQLVSLYKKGIDVFSDIRSFNQWLRKPAYGLGGRKPFDLLNTTGGINLVMEELYRIEFGALA